MFFFKNIDDKEEDTCREKMVKQTKYSQLRDIVDCHKCMRGIAVHQLGDPSWGNSSMYVVSDIINS
jgi:hypothetical protein